MAAQGRLASHVLIVAGVGLLLSSSLDAQAGLVVRGAVLDAATGNPMGGAVVAVLETSPPRFTSTTAAGAFMIRVPRDSARLVAALIGYAPETLAVTADRPATVTFRLAEAALALDPVTVSAERTFSSSTAASRLIRELDIRLRPRESSQELLQLTPGLLIAQHAGGGKAEQIFLRGFDADHGTDVAISVDGVPINMVSHAHGQGYADLHWLIPEVVEYVDVHKGSYEAQDGDLATAGAVALHTKDRLSQAEASTRGGGLPHRACARARPTRRGRGPRRGLSRPRWSLHERPLRQSAALPPLQSLRQMDRPRRLKRRVRRHRVGLRRPLERVRPDSGTGSSRGPDHPLRLDRSVRGGEHAPLRSDRRAPLGRHGPGELGGAGVRDPLRAPALLRFHVLLARQ